MTEDLRTFVALVRARFPHATIAVAGESLGGAVAIEAFASDRPPAADRLVLAAPAVWGWSSQPLAYQLALQAAAHLAPGQGVHAARLRDRAHLGQRQHPPSWRPWAATR